MPKITIEKLVYGGRGVGFINKKPVFVSLTAPYDEIEVEISKQHADYSEGVLLKILKPSPNRVTPKCEDFGRCGGCDWQHIDYSAQILWKQLILEEQLRRIGKIKNPCVLPTVPSPKAWNYRSRVKFQKDSAGRFGFYAKGSHDLVEIDKCLIADENLSTSEFFTQVNPLQNKNLCESVKTIVEKSPNNSVLELYCGNGNLTFHVAHVAGNVLASDSDNKAIEFAKEDAKEGGYKNINFVCRPAGRMVDSLVKEENIFDCVVLDPPRDGCKPILDGLSHLKPATIVYISCNPSTLARDIATLCTKGYCLESSQPIDMFPQTHHIESINIIRLSARVSS